MTISGLPPHWVFTPPLPKDDQEFMGCVLCSCPCSFSRFHVVASPVPQAFSDASVLGTQPCERELQSTAEIVAEDHQQLLHQSFE
jgi:hypothetical protein